MKYPLIIEIGDSDHCFGVVVPDLPGCFSAGDSLDEAITNAKEAIELHLEGMAEAGEEIPQAATVDHYADRAIQEQAVLAVCEVDISHYMGRSKRINITLPEYLIARIDDEVRDNSQYSSRSGFLMSGAIRQLSNAGA